MIGKTFIFVGMIFILVGLVVLVRPHLPWIGRLPGDIYIEHGNARFYFPVITCLLISLVLSFVMFLMRK